MGDQADDILTSFKLTGAQLTNYNTVKERFEGPTLFCERTIFPKEQNSTSEFRVNKSLPVTLSTPCTYSQSIVSMVRCMMT